MANQPKKWLIRHFWRFDRALTRSKRQNRCLVNQCFGVALLQNAGSEMLQNATFQSGILGNFIFPQNDLVFIKKSWTERSLLLFFFFFWRWALSSCSPFFLFIIIININGVVVVICPFWFFFYLSTVNIK